MTNFTIENNIEDVVLDGGTYRIGDIQLHIETDDYKSLWYQATYDDTSDEVLHFDWSECGWWVDGVYAYSDICDDLDVLYSWVKDAIREYVSKL